jgi:hypothetical protein
MNFKLSGSLLGWFLLGSRPAVDYLNSLRAILSVFLLDSIALLAGLPAYKCMRPGCLLTRSTWRIRLLSLGSAFGGGVLGLAGKQFLWEMLALGSIVLAAEQEPNGEGEIGVPAVDIRNVKEEVVVPTR